MCLFRWLIPLTQKFRESETTIKIKFALFRGGLGRGAGRKIVQNAIFHGKRHDNKILKVKILLSRNFVVMAQAPRNASGAKQTYFRIIYLQNLESESRSKIRGEVSM